MTHQALLPLMVLDAMMDDAESIQTLRGHGEVAPYGLALIDEADVINTVRSLLSDGLAEALIVDSQSHQLAVVGSPQLDDDSLRGYWFRPSSNGKALWRERETQLDAYWAENPIGK